MGPTLNGLIKLQSVENRLRAAKAKLTRSRRSVIIQENQVRSLQSALEAKKEELQLTKVQSSRLELELKSRDEEVSKLRAALNTSKSNKEYAAVLTQLNTTRADNAKIENQILDLMKAMETDEAECENIRKQIEEQKQQLEQTRKKSEAAAVEQEAEIAKIQAEWNEVAKTIPRRAAEGLQTRRRDLRRRGGGPGRGAGGPARGLQLRRLLHGHHGRERQPADDPR